jgi:predicted RNase H-like nuclease (RuvC/YqgF family)
MKNFLKEISQAFQNNNHSRFERHAMDIEKGEKIEINGKEFVKVKLKFVDTMDFNLAKHVDNLESENVLLNKELQELKAQLEKRKLKVEQLQICAKNMFHENARLKQRNNKDKTIVDLTRQINKQHETIEMLNKNISGQGRKIKELEAEQKSYLTKEKGLENEIKLLKGKVTSLTVEYEKVLNKLKIQTEKTKKLKKADRASGNELKNAQILVKTLTEKLFNQKNEVEYLRAKLKKLLASAKEQT